MCPTRFCWSAPSGSSVQPSLSTNRPRFMEVLKQNLIWPAVGDGRLLIRTVCVRCNREAPAVVSRHLWESSSDGCRCWLRAEPG